MYTQRSKSVPGAPACCSFDNAETYAHGRAEEIMGQAFKVLLAFVAGLAFCHRLTGDMSAGVSVSGGCGGVGGWGSEDIMGQSSRYDQLPQPILPAGAGGLKARACQTEEIWGSWGRVTS